MSAAPLIECTSTEITVGQSGQRGKRPSDLDYSHTSSTAGLPAKTKSLQTWIQFYSLLLTVDLLICNLFLSTVSSGFLRLLNISGSHCSLLGNSSYSGLWEVFPSSDIQHWCVTQTWTVLHITDSDGFLVEMGLISGKYSFGALRYFLYEGRHVLT